MRTVASCKRSLVVSTCLACLLFPATAGAARIELRAGTVAGTTELVYTSGLGEVNYPLLQHWQDWWLIQDTEGPPTERVPPCEAEPGFMGLGAMSRCPDPARNVTGAHIDLGDRDDSGNVDANTSLSIPVTVLGGPGNDRLSMHSFSGNTLDGGPGDDVISSEKPYPEAAAGGSDTVIGGEGNDKILTADDIRDVVQCGAGSDDVTADQFDSVAADCELVRRAMEGGWTRADGKPIGVSINGGALYTNSPEVRLRVRAPDVATHVRISNDGGFDSFLTRRIDGTTFGFELASSGPERLPKTVYVRFDGPGLDANRTFTDDIILDETAPVVRVARVIRRTRGGVRVALKARDAASGVRSAQFAHVRGKPWARIRYRKRVTIGGTPRWVRVRDRAGNASRWLRVGR